MDGLLVISYPHYLREDRSFAKRLISLYRGGRGLTILLDAFFIALTFENFSSYYLLNCNSSRQ